MKRLPNFVREEEERSPKIETSGAKRKVRLTFEFAPPKRSTDGRRGRHNATTRARDGEINFLTVAARGLVFLTRETVGGDAFFRRWGGGEGRTATSPEIGAADDQTRNDAADVRAYITEYTHARLWRRPFTYTQSSAAPVKRAVGRVIHTIYVYARSKM